MILLLDKVAFVQVYIRIPLFVLPVQFHQFSILISIYTLFLPEEKGANFRNLPNKTMLFRKFWSFGWESTFIA